MRLLSNADILEVFNDLKTKTGFDDVNLSFHNPAKNPHFFANHVDGVPTVNALHGPYASAGIQYLKMKNDPVYKSAQKIFGPNPSQKETLQFIMAHEFGHIDHVKQGIEFNDAGDSSVLKDRTAYKQTGPEKWADGFAEKALKPSAVVPSRGYDFSFTKGHKHEKFLNEIIGDTFGIDPNKAINQIPLYEQPLKTMLDTGELSEADYKKMTGHLNDYKEKINRLSGHNTPILGTGETPIYAPKYKVGINDDGKFINLKTQEILEDVHVGPQHIYSPDPETTPHSPHTPNKPVRPLNTPDEPIHPTHLNNPQVPPGGDPPRPYHGDAKKTAHFLKRNRGAIAIGALGLGVMKAALDGDDDDTLSTAAKAGKSAALGYGLSWGAEKLFMSETVSDLVKGEVSDVGKSILKQSDVDRKLINGGRHLPGILKVGAAIIGAATVLDIGRDIHEHVKSENIKEDQERAIVQRQRKQKDKNKKQSYGHLADGEIVLNLFGERVGHHKMGNAKFY